MNTNNQKITTVCYGRREEWNSRQEAMNHFLEAMCWSDGSELQRYATIYTKLASGENYATDGDEL